MKKLLCVFLSVLLFAFACVPAGAMEFSETTMPAPVSSENTAGEFTVTFKQPSEEYKEGYWFATSKDGEYNYVLEDDPVKLADPDWLYNNDYIYDEKNDRYLLAKDIFDNYFPENPVYYTIEKMPDSKTVAAGTIVTFKVKTSPKYNQTTVVVRANGVNVAPSVKGEYSVLVNQDITVSVVERNAANEEVLLRNHFFVYLPKGEDGEYRCRTLENTNYTVVFYGDSFDFRLVLGKDTVVNNLKVTVTRGSNMLADELGFDPAAVLGSIGIGNPETLTSYGTDASGARLYRVENVTTDINLNVSGVKTKESSDIMTLIMRILRMICNFLGINLPFLKDIDVTYNVTVNNDSNLLSYSVAEGASRDELNGNVYKVGKNDNLTLIVYKQNVTDNVIVTWTPGNEAGGNHASEWIEAYDQNNDRPYLYAIYNIDNITEDTVVSIALR